MELLYLWVDNYQEGLIDKQGLNFDNRFRYQMKEKNEEHELHIKANPNFIEDFFKPEDKSLEEIAEIKNITAIVGQNGTGKSSILDFLKENFGAYSAEDNGEKTKNYLYITREYRGKEFLHYIYFPKEMNINIKIPKEYVYEIRNDQDIPCGLEKTTLIYFSNVYDNKEEYSVENMLNISTNHLAANNLSVNFSQTPEKFIGSEGLDFKFKEIKRQIQFIYAIKERNDKFELPFKMPTQIDLFYRGKKPSLSLKHHVGKGNKKNILDFIYEVYNSTNASRGNKFSLHVNAGRNAVIGFTRCILAHLYSELCAQDWKDIIEEIEFIMPQQEKDDYYRLRVGIQQFASILKNSDKKFDKLVNMLMSIERLMDNFQTKYNYGTKKSGAKYKFSFDIKEEVGYEFKEFLYLYENSCINNDFIDFSWRNLSSGESALLNIYSRFYFASRRWELTENIDNDLVILIDEGEIYLHPHWQGKFLNNLIEYFPIVFRNIGGKKQRNIQIILTSNSPFVVSDLPSTNIIFLKKEMEKSVVIDSLEEYHQTFAANIHSLLAHSFFMEDGVTGTFANRKINEIIELLVNEDINKILQNEKKIEKTINLIGEPLIRHKLAQMLSDKLSIRILSAEREIERLKSRLDELESLKNDTNKA
ncbi:AAA family ATPase [Bacillus toyonensis]|uniref:AAA family ATPase n=1 Tax=Bacillus toyonensis TaxID=155322 RepID=UPI000BFB2F17|nr:AAA family ATPase [Bacillus toyonensis]PHC16607.1 hypothetical protein COE97_08750 [Bacillus toyonensis]PHD98153.1 hypothetical protein COF43_17630 [Bacillus toyonensis]PHE13867.1 hypothetical protein COF41_24105 [Bacillus toyonensis]